MRTSSLAFLALVSASAAMAACTEENLSDSNAIIQAFVACQTDEDPVACISALANIPAECSTCLVAEVESCSTGPCQEQCETPEGCSECCGPTVAQACVVEAPTEEPTEQPAAEPTNAPTKEEDVVTFPFALLGVWNTNAEASEDPSQSYCYDRLEATDTEAKLTKICANKSGRESPVSTATMSNPSVVSCGQQNQIGQAYGVFGGFLDNTPTCVYFSRVSPSYIGRGQRNAIMDAHIVTVEECAEHPGQVCCPAHLPENIEHTDAHFICQSGDCLDSKSSYCRSKNPKTLRQIGLGMGIGGVGLLLSTLAVAMGISHVLEG